MGRQLHPHAAILTGCAGISVQSNRQRQWCHRQHRTLDGRCFFPAPTTNIRIPLMLTALSAASHEPCDRSKGVDSMRRQLAALVSCAFVATSGAVLAHHSFAMFDQENPVELEGVVQEFKFTSPHSYILLEVKGAEGNT